MTPHRGPVFVDFPLDVVFGPGDGDDARRRRRAARAPSPIPTRSRRAAELHRRRRAAGAHRRQRRVVGRRVGGAAGRASRRCGSRRSSTASAGAACPADHELAFSRTRGLLKGEADVVVRRRHAARLPPVVRLASATPRSSTSSTAPTGGPPTSTPAASPAGDLAHDPRPASPTTPGRGPTTSRGSPGCATPRRPAPAADEPLLAADSRPDQADAHLRRAAPPPRPRRRRRVRRRRLRVLRRQVRRLLRAGLLARPRALRLPRHRRWATPSPPGSPTPTARSSLLLGDGAVGFSLMDVDTLVRHELPVVIVVGNNGIWGLEKHPMQMLYGYDVAADLQPGCRYDEVVAGPRRRRRDGRATPTTSAPPSTGPSPPACPTSSTSSPTRPTSTRGPSNLA